MILYVSVFYDKRPNSRFERRYEKNYLVPVACRARFPARAGKPRKVEIPAAAKEANRFHTGTPASARERRRNPAAADPAAHQRTEAARRAVGAISAGLHPGKTNS